MRQLILLRGAPGCGKSTWIEDNNLKAYTICPDDIRLMIQTPIQTLEGNFQISQKNDKDVWSLVFQIMEKRMSRGELTIIDATHSRTTLISKYKHLIDQYRYRTFIVDFTDIPIEEVKRRNKCRSEYKQVPEDVIDLSYSRFETQKAPNWCKVIKPEKFHEEMVWRREDFSQYKKIVHIGDIHGCYEPLAQYFIDNPFDDENLYIFVGDYVDRGIQNAEVMNFLLTIFDKPNVICLQGNHECISKDTEILTTSGFKNIQEISLEDNIAQFDIDTKNISYSKPLSLVKNYSEDIIIIESDTILQKVTPNHDIIYEGKKIKAKELLNIEEVIQTSFITSGNFDSLWRVNLDDDWIRLLSWVVFDGTMVDCRKYNKLNSKSFKVRIQFKLSKERKIESLRNLLDRMSIPYTFKPATKSGVNKLQPYYIRIYGNSARDIFMILNGVKKLPSDFKLFDRNQANILLDVISITDGFKDGNRIKLISTDEDNINIIQEICIRNNITCYYTKSENRSGFGSLKPQYEVVIYPSKIYNKKCKVSIENYNDEVFCVEMPKGTIITRNEGKIIFTGNCWTWRWACNKLEDIRSKEFVYKTMPQLEGKVDKDECRRFYRKLQQIVYYEYPVGDKTYQVLVNHAGISSLPSNLIYMSLDSFIHGVGTYNDDIDRYWLQNTDMFPTLYQIRGHRNILDIPIQSNERSFCLEGKVEYGGELRIVELSPEGFKTIEIKNTVFDPELKNKQELRKVLNGESTLNQNNVLQVLRKNKLIMEKEMGDDISSFNFSRRAFQDREWNSVTVRARGLFVDTSNGNIIARSYDKFFNHREIEATKSDTLNNNLKFPVVAYLKENGFLGLISYNPKNDDFFIASKSTNKGPYVEYIKKIFFSMPLDFDRIKAYVKENNVTLVLEVVDPINDPHIIEYPKPTIYLLDIIKNEYVFSKMPYKELCNFAFDYGFEPKLLAEEFTTWDDLYEFLHKVEEDYDYVWNGASVEGFAFEDANGFMFKKKTGFYGFWKHMRGVKETYAKGRVVNLAGLFNARSNYFYGWLKTLSKEYVLSKSIIDLRKEYEESKDLKKVVNK